MKKSVLDLQGRWDTLRKAQSKYPSRGEERKHKAEKVDQQDKGGEKTNNYKFNYIIFSGPYNKHLIIK